jgi:hypothetical protein
MKRILCFATLLAMWPVLGEAQGTPGPEEARVEAALAKAAEAGIPVTLLERKVAEGRAKGIPMARIAAAVENRLQALLQAHRVLEGASVEGATDGDLSVAADAVEAGVSESALLAISEGAPQERRAVAIAVLTDLVALGHASERALAQVQEALRRGPEALANLQARTGAELRARGAQGVGAGVGSGARGGRVDPPGQTRGRGRGRP